jgi:hypothetical protein
LIEYLTMSDASPVAQVMAEPTALAASLAFSALLACFSRVLCAADSCVEFGNMVGDFGADKKANPLTGQLAASAQIAGNLVLEKRPVPAPDRDGA